MKKKKIMREMRIEMSGGQEEKDNDVLVKERVSEEEKKNEG